MPSYWKRYLAAAKAARQKLARRVALSKRERERLEQLKDESSVEAHVIAIDKILEHSDWIEEAWNPERSLSEQWEPRKSIDDKQKTGDHEHFDMVWTAVRCIVGGKSSSPYAERQARRQFSRAHAKSVHGDVGSTLAVVAKYLKQIDDELAPDFAQFVVNLALFDFRTAGGGRARKISNWLRIRSTGTLDEIGYLRPFDEGLPYAVDTLLAKCRSSVLNIRTSPSKTRDLSRGLCSYTARRYVAPTRFTATFPVILTGNKIERLPTARENVLTYVDPQFTLEDRDTGSVVKYAFMGSFGFAEPSYTTWAMEDEYAGTRLSLGAYSLNPVYLAHLTKLAKTAALTLKLKGYGRYGSVGLRHLAALTKVAETYGHKLSFIWALDMVRIAKALTKAAQKQATSKQQAGLVDFFTFVAGKIDRRHTKLNKVLRSTLDELTSFEYIWVQESALWELAFLAASCLSLPEMFDALGRLSTRPQTSVSLAENIHERVRIRVSVVDSCVYHRLYGPSGTAAATTLCKTLGKQGFTIFGIVASQETLNTFKPYFEFYQPGFLGVGEVGGFNLEISKPKGTQLWVNLSDDLHGYLLEQGCPHDKAGAVIASLLVDYVESLKVGVEVLLVIDFTKFGSDMPNTVLLPLLAALENSILGQDWCAGVVFLRSTLKYNTGPLDRYQAGEVLVRATGCGVSLIPALADALGQYFSKGADFTNGKKWALNGHYISMMKKVYLLSEFITTRRWELYATTWKS
ncbi:hypothetical protein ACNOYE_02220 [Nannocystaceae bacterium ST9]